MKSSWIYALLVLAAVSLVGWPVKAAPSTQDATPLHVYDLAWNPDGMEIAVFASNGVFAYDRAFQLLRYQEMANGAYGGWSSDGTQLIVGSQVWDADTLNVRFDVDVTVYGGLRGGAQVYSSSGTEISIFDAADGRLIETVPLGYQVEYVRSNHAGTQIISGDGKIVSVFDLDRRTRTARYTLPVESMLGFTLNADDTRLVYSASKRVPQGTPGSTPMPLDPGMASLTSIGILDMTIGEVLLESDPLPEAMFSFSWTGDGTRIAGLSQSGTVYIWNADTLELLTAFSAAEYPSMMGYSPYGGVMAVKMEQPEDDSRRPPTPQYLDDTVQPIAALPGGAVQLIVPAPSLDQLQAISANCDAPIVVEQPGADTQADQLANVIEQVRTLPEGAVPPGCAADLVAVAEALQGG
jgi:hypothetical protein